MPSIIQVSASAPAQICRPGQRLALRLECSGDVAVDGSDGQPKLLLSNGAVAIYDPATSTSRTLIFQYDIGTADDVADLLVWGLSLDGATITAVHDGSSLDVSGLDQLPGADTHIAVSSSPPNPPVITSPGGITPRGDLVISGRGDPGDLITVVDNSIYVIATATVNSDGIWTAPVALADGQHSLAASQSSALSGSSNLSSPVIYTVDHVAPEGADVAFTDAGTGLSSYAQSASYDGPVSYLDHEFMWTGTGSVAISASAANSFLHGGAGDDALQVTAGSNVLDGGAGSNFLIGALGTDGGLDSFFTDARGGVVTWSTIINFHSGDYATLWGFDPNVSTMYWEDSAGVAG